MEWLGDELHCFAWAVVRSQRTGALSKARSASFMLPDQIVQLVRQGVELGDADDRVFGRVKSGQGCVGGWLAGWLGGSSSKLSWLLLWRRCGWPLCCLAAAALISWPAAAPRASALLSQPWRTRPVPSPHPPANTRTHPCRSGTVGKLTGGLITRAGYYEHAVLLALLPFMNPQLYPEFAMEPGS